MSTPMIEIDIDTLHLLLRHDPETGRLFWRERDVSLFPDGKQSAAQTAASWNSRFAGKEAGKLSDGWMRVGILGRQYSAARVCFAMENGFWPAEKLNHVDGDVKDNRLSKLREATPLEIARNRRRMSANASSKITGVTWNKVRRKWAAYIYVSRTYKFLGHFESIEAAAACRKLAEAQFGFNPDYGRRA